MLKDKIKGAVIGLLVGSTLTGSIAFAKTGSQMIEAVYSNIKIYVNGNKVNTSSNEPFIYDGSTYLPVRAVSEALGQQVTWDGNTKSVYIGQIPGGNSYLTDIMDPFVSNYFTAYTPSNGKSMSMGGQKYTNGFTLGQDNWETISNATYNLNGIYNSLTLTIGYVEGTSSQSTNTIKFYLDDRLAKEMEIKADDIPQTISLPLNYATKLKIEKDKGFSVTGFGNVIIK